MDKLNLKLQTAEQTEPLFLLQNPYLQARQFWRSLWPVLRAETNRDKCLKIVLWRAGPWLQPVLIQGLLHNLFHPDQHLQYILVDSVSSLETVRQKNIKWRTSLLRDEILSVPDTDSEAARAAEESADLLILFQRNSGVNRCKNPPVLFCQLLPDPGQSAVLQTSLMIQAQWIHEAYQKEQETSNCVQYPVWEKLDPMIQCSNISAASICEVWDLLRQAAPEKTDEQLQLASLEHIRWCRFRTLFPNQSESSLQNQQHKTMMVPYDQLSEPLQAKDIRNAQNAWHLPEELQSSRQDT